MKTNRPLVKNLLTEPLREEMRVKQELAGEDIPPLNKLILSKLHYAPPEFLNPTDILHQRLPISASELFLLQSEIVQESWRVFQEHLIPKVVSSERDGERTKRKRMLKPIQKAFREREKELKALIKDWREQKDRVAYLELVVERSRSKRVVRAIREEELNKFDELVARAQRRKGGKIVLSDLSRKAKIAFPKGIAGRMMDDKYCKILLDPKERSTLLRKE